MQAPASGDIVPFPLLAGQLPEVPPAALDPVLDAAAVCLGRHGLSRTSLSDIARELRVAPSTVYRKVGSVENAAWLLAARESHAVLARLPELVAGVEGARRITVFLAAGIRAAWDHPAFAKTVRDEPDFVGRAITGQLDELLRRGAAVMQPFLAAAMELGFVREQDPQRLADWLIRVVTIALLSPPPGDLQAALDELLLPLLEP